jgi:CPA2 family monovalent cation:H+ antiporter-2
VFAIGAQVSIPDLLRYRNVAVAGGLLQVAVMLAVGWLAGLALGWGTLESLFLGAVVSNSSSAVLAKVLAERGEGDSRHGHLGLAWSTVQDVSAVVLIVLLSALAQDGADALDLLGALATAVAFLALLVPVGLVVGPRLFELLAAVRSREVFVLGVVGLALGTAYLGTFFGISLALGAFLAGALVAESDLSHRVLGEALPFRDLFAGLFFVSIGMLVDPGFVVADPALVMLGVALIVPIKGTVVALIARLFRSPPRIALLTGIALAQSAEFSFLLARVGADLGAIGPAAFNLMIAAAAGSIVLAPFLHQLGPSLARRIEARSRVEPQAVPGPVRESRTVAIVCGYGRVGRLVGGRSCGAASGPSSWSSTDGPSRRPAAPVSRSCAAVLVVALPDPLATRRIVDHARRARPRLPIVVRTHSLVERAALLRLGASEVVVG